MVCVDFNSSVDVWNKKVWTILGFLQWSIDPLSLVIAKL